ncbi:MAG: HNH endonuclease [Thermoplasmatota archaeon]
MSALGRRPPPPEPYQKFRAPLQAKWRPLIIARDGNRCRSCRRRSPDGEGLDMAHITDAVAFVRAGGHHRAVTFSYRWDNLVTLCTECHRASHAFRLDEKTMPRKERVGTLFAKLRRLRGWSTPFAALPPALVPPALRPARSFHDVLRVSPLLPFPTFARYAADGGLAFGDQEAGPSQARLCDPAPGRPGTPAGR